MSLPDTVFIFVLALIIFGPKKLPEIGRQLGRLVGEFRRASNEFKFQIEEELRQVDFADKRSDQQTIAASTYDTAPTSDGVEVPALTEGSADLAEDSTQDPAGNIAVGQHPNVDSLDISEFGASGMNSFGLSDSGMESTNVESAGDVFAGDKISGDITSESSDVTEPPETSASVPAIIPAAGSEPRTMAPYVAAEPAAGRAVEVSGELPAHSGGSSQVSSDPTPNPPTFTFQRKPETEGLLPPSETATSAVPYPAPAVDPAPAEAEITHG